MKLDLEHYVPGLLLWVSNRLTSSASNLYRRRFNLGVTDWRLLSYFHVYPSSTAASASELMGIDKAAVSRSVATLISTGSLEPRPVGLRRIEYSLTPTGHEVHDQISVVALDRQEALLAGFSREERATLNDFLHRMLANIPGVMDVGAEEVVGLPGR